MQLFAVLVGSALALGLIAFFAALRLAFDLRGVGQASGAWAVAFGVEVGPLQFAGTTGSAVTRLELRLFGFRVPLPREKPAARRERPKPDPEASPGRNRWLDQLDWLDPLDAGLFLLGERRHVTIESLDVELDYGFRDVALTGKIAGALYMLSGVLPAPVRLHQNPSWEGSETWQAHVTGRVAAWPALVAADILWYILRARFRRRPAPPNAEPAAGTAA